MDILKKIKKKNFNVTPEMYSKIKVGDAIFSKGTGLCSQFMQKIRNLFFDIICLM